MRYLKRSRIKKKIKELGFRVGQEALNLLDRDFEKVLVDLVETCKYDHVKTIKVEHIEILKRRR